MLDGLVAAAAALLAGGAPTTALRLGVSMVLLQASVGALNDLVDAPHDAGRKPGKPIPAGLVRPAAARLISIVAGIAGVALAVPSGAGAIVLAVVLLALGAWYDLRLKGTAWSWLPFALAIPLFPAYGWLGAAGSLPPLFALLLPTAVLAGTALAIGNASVDLERDAAAGIGSVALALGRDRSWWLHAVLLAVVVGVAVLSLAIGSAAWPPRAGVGAGGLIVGVGVDRLRSDRPERRELGWKLEAVGVGVLATAWLVGIVEAGLAGA